MHQKEGVDVSWGVGGWGAGGVSLSVPKVILQLNMKKFASSKNALYSKFVCNRTRIF